MQLTQKFSIDVTAKEESRKKCMEAMLRLQTKMKRESPKEWIRPLFEKEL